MISHSYDKTIYFQRYHMELTLIIILSVMIYLLVSYKCYSYFKSGIPSGNDLITIQETIQESCPVMLIVTGIITVHGITDQISPYSNIASTEG